MNSFKILILILVLAIGLGACQDFLSPTKDNQYDKERFMNDPTWALGLLINAYTNGSYLRTVPMNEVATDDAVSNDQANNYLRMATGEWSSLFYPNNVWGNGYNAIIYMNYFLSLVNEVQWSGMDTIKNRLFRERLAGEAYGFRGFYYTRLLQEFGGKGADGNMLGVPIVAGIITPESEWKVQRSTYQETYDQIIADYNKAIKLMPYQYFEVANATLPADIAWNQVNGASVNLNRMDGRAVTALKARLSLMASSPAYNGGTYDLVKADSAAKIAARLISKNGGLTASVGPDPIYWDNDNDITNTDILWRNDFYSNNTLEADNYPPTLYGRGRVNPTQNLVDAYPMKNGYPINHPLSGFDPANPYANRDMRLNKDIMYNGGMLRISGTIGSNALINTQADSPDNNGLNKLPLYSTRTGYYLKKLMRAATVLTPGSATSLRHVYPIIRWTEVLLIYAEAANEVYGPDADGGNGITARQVISSIRKRGAGNAIANSGIPAADPYLASITSKEAMRDLIRNERRIELSFEGFRFWDLRRWNVPLNQLAAPAKGVAITGTTPKVYDYTSLTAGINPVETRNYDSHMYYGPIPLLETKKYPGFVQNQGW